MGEEVVEVRDVIIDFFIIKFVRNFWEYGVIFSENFFGDILSDFVIVYVGSIGIVFSGNYGDGIVFFELVYGFVFDIVGKGIVNFIGVILSGVMFFDYFGFDGLFIRVVVRGYVVNGELMLDMGGRVRIEDVVRGIIGEIEDFLFMDEVWWDEIRLSRLESDIS